MIPAFLRAFKWSRRLLGLRLLGAPELMVVLPEMNSAMRRIVGISCKAGVKSHTNLVPFHSVVQIALFPLINLASQTPSLCLSGRRRGVPSGTLQICAKRRSKNGSAQQVMMELESGLNSAYMTLQG